MPGPWEPGATQSVAHEFLDPAGNAGHSLVLRPGSTISRLVPLPAKSIAYVAPDIAPAFDTVPEAPVMKTPKEMPVIEPVKLFATLPPSASSTPELPVPVPVMAPLFVTVRPRGI